MNFNMEFISNNPQSHHQWGIPNWLIGVTYTWGPGRQFGGCLKCLLYLIIIIFLIFIYIIISFQNMKSMNWPFSWPIFSNFTLVCLHFLHIFSLIIFEFEFLIWIWHFGVFLSCYQKFKFKFDQICAPKRFSIKKFRNW